jgi:hypothetical protein
MKIKNFFNLFFMVSSFVVLTTSCGKKNTSGGGGGQVVEAPIGGVPGVGLPGPGGQIQGITANTTQAVQIVRQETICREGSGRTTIQMQLPTLTGSIGATYIGKTSFGDIAYIVNFNGISQLVMEICQRAGLIQGQSQGTLSYLPILNRNLFNCLLDEITAMDVNLTGQGVQYQLAFAPVHIPNAGRFSQICVGR